MTKSGIESRGFAARIELVAKDAEFTVKMILDAMTQLGR